MPSCELKLILDRPGPFAAGTSVSGKLFVRAGDELHADGSKVSLAFETRGQGAGYRSPEVTSTGGPFAMSAGEERSIPFDLALPTEPVTTVGTVVGVSWVLRAELDVPWALDPAADVEIVVDGPIRAASEARPSGSTSARVDASSTPPTPTPRPSVLRYAPHVLLGLTAVFVASRMASADLDAPRQGAGLQLLLFLAVAAYLVWLFAGRRLLNRYAARGIGEPRVSASAERALRGERVAVRVTMVPPGEVTLAGVTARLIGTQTAHSGGGRDRRTHEHAEEGDVIELSGATTVRAGEARRWEGELRVPEGARPTFEAPNNFIRWEIEVAIVRVGGVDHVTRLPLHVAP